MQESRWGAEQAATLRAALEDRLRARLDPKQFNLFLNPNEQLARALAEGLKKVSNTLPLIIFLDTYEIVDRADLWLRVAMCSAGPSVIWVISGRNNLHCSGSFGPSYFKGYADEFPRRLLHYDLGQLAEQDIRTLFADRAPNRSLDNMIVESIKRATLGVPLAIDEAAEMWAKGVPLEDIVGDPTKITPRHHIVKKMTTCYLLHAVTEDAEKRALYALALAQGDIEILRAMLRPADSAAFDLNALLHRLERDYASVSYTYARLHDEPAFFIRAFLKENLHRTEDSLKALIRRAIETLGARLEKLQSEHLCLNERCEDEDWVKSVLDLTEYLFWLDESEAWRWLMPHFIASMAYSTDLRQGLIQVASGWKEQLSISGRKRLKLIKAASYKNAFPKGYEALLDELKHIQQLGWLKNEFEDEYKAIIEWQHGLLLFSRRKFRDVSIHYERAECFLPECGESFKKLLGEGLFKLSGELVWPKGAKSAIYSFEAEKILRKVVQWLPDKQGAWYRLGVIQKNRGDCTAALPMYQQAILLDPKYAAPHNGLGNVYKALGKYEEAIVAYQQAILLDPKGAYPHNNLGNVYKALGKYEEAIAAYQQAIQIDPKDAFPHNNLAEVYLHLQEMDKAIFELNERIRLNPLNTFAPLITLGVITYHQGLPENEQHFKDALAQWDAACRHKLQTPAGLLENKAIALLCTGNQSQALATIRESVDQMTQGDTIEFDYYSLLQTAPNPPDGLEEMISILKEAQAKRKKS